MNIIAQDYSELLTIAHLLYISPGGIHYQWEDGSWWNTNLQEGVNQGWVAIPSQTLVYHAYPHDLAFNSNPTYRVS